jgi:helix-turn-helix protein
MSKARTVAGRSRPHPPQTPTPPTHQQKPPTSDAIPPIEPAKATTLPAPATEENEPVLFTPEQAAALLQVRPSWLRRRAAARTVPCRFLGKHLRFAREDIAEIAVASRQPPRTPTEPVTRYRQPPGRA